MTTTTPLAVPVPRFRIPGNKGIWAGISCEFVEFSVLFAVYFIARAHFPEAFHDGAQRLSVTAGTVITLLMITSSYFIACSVNAIRQDQHRAAIIWLVRGLAVALGYPLTKALEISWNLANGINGESGIFFTVYYYLTFTHLVHATWGILGILWVLARLSFRGYSSDDHAGLEALACYWHATDIIWLVIFPMFYVLA
ncbi:cytochrome c oxidase subunit 3 family protein [Dechloromonas sp. HYN0024]|uniref:cytochrome c oxidase subunit 3 family protein n=1 Tax=Dechloromonas sp. HYN0024 TaxID=2231055 RepID=UPI000E443EA2|nr:cytochrome c oxidase subunit 3 family protein [Dechloromonas sp. HYN0024]AXS78906.1 cytochrome c oxidase subunit 3 family protein [Dechloromonas sp. HYN0024]